MKNAFRIIIWHLLATGLASSAFAETRVSGEVSGRWERNGNPYIATGDLSVVDNRTLFIEPGVDIRFEGNFTFYVYGKLIARADEGDSIRFDVIAGGEAWGGLRLLNSDTTRLDYCVITNGRALRGEGELDTLGAGGNVFISGGDVVIDHSRISRGRARTNGGGLAIWRASSIIRNSIISANESMSFGGGVSIVAGATPVFTSCSIEENTSNGSGGGAWIFLQSNPLFESCIIKDNACTNGEIGNGGGAFMAEASSPRFRKCEFLENTASAGGGAYARGAGTNPNFEWCYFWGNSTNLGSRVGGGMYVRGGAGPSVVYTRFVENNANQGGGIFVKEPPHLTVDHCLFLRNAATRAGGAVAASTDLGETPLRLNNCTFIDNRNIGGEPIAHTAYARRPVEGQPGSMIIINSSIVFGPHPLFAEEGRVQVRYSNILNGFAGEGNTSEYPEFFKQDSIWFILAGDSRCVDSGDSLLPVDPDRSRTDRGWLHFPHNAWETLPDEPLYGQTTTDARTILPFTYRNETGVPIYVTPMDRWNEGPREVFIDVSRLTNDNEIQAVAATETGYYLAGGNNGEDPNYIYHIDDSLNLRGRFEQPSAPENEGFTDLATDGGSVLYGCYDDFIIEFSTDGEFGQDYRSPEGVAVCRAIGSDFENPTDFVDFYAGGNEGEVVRADAGMFEINSTSVGDTIQAIGVKGNSRAVYAITSLDTSRAMLWLVSPDEQKATPLYPLNLPAGYRQGGVEVSQKFRPGKGFLIGILKGEGDNVDRLYALELYTSWLVIQPSLTLLEPDEEMRWPIEFAGDQMPAGFYETSFILSVNGYGRGGEVDVQMRSDPGKAGEDPSMGPNTVKLAGPYPNPFNSEARIRFSLDRAAYAEIWITDVTGRGIRRVAGELFTSGEHLANIDAHSLPSGQYYIRLTLPDRTLVKPLTLIK